MDTKKILEQVKNGKNVCGGSGRIFPQTTV